MAFVTGFITGSIAAFSLVSIVFVIIATLEFRIDTGEDGMPTFVRKNKKRRSVKKTKKVKLKQQPEQQVIVQTAVPVQTEERLEEQQEELEKSQAMGLLLSAQEISPVVQKQEVEEEKQQPLKQEEKVVEEEEDEDEVESVKSVASEIQAKATEEGTTEKQSDLREEESREVEEMAEEEEEVEESEYLYSSKVHLMQEEIMKFFTIFDQDAHFVTAFEGNVRFTEINTMNLILPIQQANVHYVAEVSGDHVGCISFSNDFIYCLTVGVPSNTFYIHRVFHQLMKPLKLIMSLKANFSGPEEWRLGEMRTISQEYAVVVGTAGKELKLWEVNLKQGRSDNESVVDLEHPIKKLFVFGKNDAFRTIHPGAKATGEHLYLGCFMANSEIIIKDVSIKKNAKGKTVFDVTDMFSLGHFRGVEFEPVNFAINTRTYKTSKYMLCASSSNDIYLYKRGSERLAKGRGSKNSTLLREKAKEILSCSVDSSEKISDVGIATFHRLIVVACGRDLIFYTYNARNKNAREVERIEKAHKTRITEVVVSGDERFLATREQSENGMKVWQLEKLASFEKFESVNESVAE